MILRIGQHWWTLALRGVVAIALGMLAILWPGLTLSVLVLLFGAYLFADGIVAVVAALRWRYERERWLPLLAEGVLGIAVGAMTLLLPAFAAFAWVFIVAGWAIATGILELGAAWRLRHHLVNEIFLALTGLVSIVLGVAFLLFPIAGLIVWIWLLGSYAIMFGVLLIALAIRLRSAAHQLGGRIAY